MFVTLNNMFLPEASSLKKLLKKKLKKLSRRFIYLFIYLFPSSISFMNFILFFKKKD